MTRVQLNKLTVAKLRERCRRAKLPVYQDKGKRLLKADLVGQLVRWHRKTTAKPKHSEAAVPARESIIVQALAEQLMDHGIYVSAFSFPVVPKGKARVRTQMSAAHSREQLDQAIAAFIAVGQQLKLI
jgi:7-keto-8-aminopelargonate synthetase-like enzyme